MIFFVIFLGNARIVYERAVEFYGDDNLDESLFIAFARFEENQREVGLQNHSHPTTYFVILKN